MAVELRLRRSFDRGRNSYHVQSTIDYRSLERRHGVDILTNMANNLLDQMEHYEKEQNPMATISYPGDHLTMSDGTGSVDYGNIAVTSTGDALASGTISVNDELSVAGWEPGLNKSEVDRIVEKKLRKMYENGDAPVAKFKRSSSDPMYDLRKKVDQWLAPAFRTLQLG